MDKVRGKLNSFTIKMSEVIDWKDLAGINGIQMGNLKKVKIDWTWLEILKFLIIWSYMAAGVSIEDNINETWSPNADDFEEKRKFKVGQAKKKPSTKKKENVHSHRKRCWKKERDSESKGNSFQGNSRRL